MGEDAGGVRYLTKEEFFEKASLSEEDYKLPSGIGTVRLRGCTADEVLELVNAPSTGDETSDRMKRYILAGVIEPKFTVADLSMLGSLSSVDVIGMANRVMDLSGLGGNADSFLAEIQKPNSIPSSVSDTSIDSPANSQEESQ